MARKNSISYPIKPQAPETLDNNPFYGIQCDEYQKKFRDAIWNPEKLIVFCNAKAGTGKTTIAAATANLLCEYGLYDGIVYIAAPTQEQKQGYLAGSIEEKSEPYFEPFYEALLKIGVNLNTVLFDNIMNEKNGTAYVRCLTHTFLRGVNFENKVVIIDEAQNMTPNQVRGIITRAGKGTKIILLGDPCQIDRPFLDERTNGLSYAAKYMQGSPYCAQLTLSAEECERSVLAMDAVKRL